MGDRRESATRERGTALMLAPALVLVVLVLGSIAVDLSLLHTARRSAYRSLSAAADDAAAMVDARHFQLTGEVRLDPAAAERVARAHLGLLGPSAPDGFEPPGFDVARADVAVDPDGNSVTITATVEVHHVMLPAVPGMEETTEFTMAVTGRMS